MDRGRQGTNRALDALIGRRQLELSIERFEVMAEFLSKRQSMINCRRSRFRHGGEPYDTGSVVVATIRHLCGCSRRLFNHWIQTAAKILVPPRTGYCAGVGAALSGKGVQVAPA